MLVHDVESVFEKGNELQEEGRVRFVNIAKMLAYLVSWFMCHIDDEIIKESSKTYVGKVCLLHMFNCTVIISMYNFNQYVLFSVRKVQSRT